MEKKCEGKSFSLFWENFKPTKTEISEKTEQPFLTGNKQTKTNVTPHHNCTSCTVKSFYFAKKTTMETQLMTPCLVAAPFDWFFMTLQGGWGRWGLTFLGSKERKIFVFVFPSVISFSHFSFLSRPPLKLISHFSPVHITWPKQTRVFAALSPVCVPSCLHPP